MMISHPSNVGVVQDRPLRGPATGASEASAHSNSARPFRATPTGAWVFHAQNRILAPKEANFSTRVVLPNWHGRHPEPLSKDCFGKTLAEPMFVTEDCKVNGGLRLMLKRHEPHFLAERSTQTAIGSVSFRRAVQCLQSVAAAEIVHKMC